MVHAENREKAIKRILRANLYIHPIEEKIEDVVFQGLLNRNIFKKTHYIRRGVGNETGPSTNIGTKGGIGRMNIRGRDNLQNILFHKRDILRGGHILHLDGVRVGHIYIDIIVR